MDLSQFQTLLSKFESLVERLERVERATGVATPQPSTSAPPQAAQAKPAASSNGSSQLNSLLKDFDTEVVSKIKAFEDAANAIGGEVIPKIVSNKQYLSLNRPLNSLARFSLRRMSSLPFKHARRYSLTRMPRFSSSTFRDI
jgi:hypothetical protein